MRVPIILRGATLAKGSGMALRVAVDGRPLRHPHTGVGVYTRELLTRLAAQCELFIYLDRPMEQPGIGATFRIPLERPRGKDPRRQGGPRLGGFLRANFQFPRWARADRAHVFWSPRHHLPLALRDLPTVVTIHDLVWRVAPRTMRPLNRLADATLMPLAVRQAERVIAVSEHTRSSILRWHPRPGVCVTPLGASTVAKAVPFAHPRPFFLFVGTREPRKNLTGLIEAFRLAVAAGLTGHDLVLAGDAGWKQAGWKRQIEASGLGRRVVDLGALPAARLAGVYAAATALVLVSFHEGFGIPLVEAMRHGTPAIASQVGSLPEVAGDAAVWVDPTRPEEIASALLRLATDRPFRERLAANARRRMALFSWDTTAAQTLAILKAAAQGH